MPIRIKQLAQPTRQDLDWFLAVTGLTTGQLNSLIWYCEDEMGANYEETQEIRNTSGDVQLSDPHSITIYETLFPLTAVTVTNPLSHGHFEIVFVAAAQSIPISCPDCQVSICWSNLNQDGTPAFTPGSRYCLSFRFLGRRLFVTPLNLYTVAQLNQ